MAQKKVPGVKSRTAEATDPPWTLPTLDTTCRAAPRSNIQSGPLSVVQTQTESIHTSITLGSETHRLAKSHDDARDLPKLVGEVRGWSFPCFEHALIVLYLYDTTERGGGTGLRQLFGRRLLPCWFTKTAIMC